jgi:hypothetical protein
MNIKTCPVCGTSFTAKGRKKYCTKECAASTAVVANRERARDWYYVSKRKKNDSLDGKLAECRLKGETYAEYQTGKTIAEFAKVEVEI